MHFVLGTNTFGAGDECVSCWRSTLQRWRQICWKGVFNLHTYAHTQLHVATSDFQAEFMSRWALSRSGDPKGRCTTTSLVALNWTSRPSKLKNQSRTSADSHLCSHLQAFSSPGVAWLYLPHPKQIEQKLQKSTTEHTRHLWRQCWVSSRP